jgi:hypothetical protein
MGRRENGVPSIDVSTPIALCTPFLNSENYIHEYLKHVYALDYPKNLMSLFFLVTGKDSTWNTLQQFKKLSGNQYAKIKIQRIKNFAGGEHTQVRNIALCRNTFVKMSNPLDIVFLDGDTFPPPQMINRLKGCISLGADVSGGIFPHLVNSSRELRVAFYAFIREGGQSWYYSPQTDRVDNGMLYLKTDNRFWNNRFWVDSIGGGIFYVKREVLNKIPFKLEEGSEEVSFCFHARDLGYKVMIDTGLYCRHWGLELEKMGETRTEYIFKMKISPEMVARRRKLLKDKMY